MGYITEQKVHKVFDKVLKTGHPPDINFLIIGANFRTKEIMDKRGSPHYVGCYKQIARESRN